MSLNLDVIRQQFPSLDRPAIFFDNPGGTQIAKPSLDRITRYLIENNANHEGLFETSRKSDEMLHEAAQQENGGRFRGLGPDDRLSLVQTLLYYLG